MHDHFIGKSCLHKCVARFVSDRWVFLFESNYVWSTNVCDLDGMCKPWGKEMDDMEEWVLHGRKGGIQINANRVPVSLYSQYVAGWIDRKSVDYLTTSACRMTSSSLAQPFLPDGNIELLWMATRNCIWTAHCSRLVSFQSVVRCVVSSICVVCDLRIYFSIIRRTSKPWHKALASVESLRCYALLILLSTKITKIMKKALRGDANTARWL